MDYVCVIIVANELICDVVITEPIFARVNYFREK